MLFTSALIVVGCSSANPAPPASGTSPSPTPSPDPSDTAAAVAAADEADLPMPADDIAAWAATAVPGPDDADYVSAHSGWLSQNTSPTFVIENHRVPADDYTLHLACMGDGEIVVTIETVRGEPLPGGSSTSCAGSTTAQAISIPDDGIVSTLSLMGAPTVFALAFTNPA